MTVQAAAAPVASVDLDAAAQQMTEIYGLYWERLRVFIWKRLDLNQEHLAEDLASETFLELWRRYFLTGRGPEVAKPYGLLCTMARSQVGQHFIKRGNLERALDFTDPANTPVLATGHAYALERPDTTVMVRDLDDAMETMRAASTAWRDAHKASHGLRSMLADGYNASRGGLTEGARKTLRQQLADAEQHEDATLHVFRGTCARVGQLRAEVEAVAGPHWRSSLGLPVNPEITATKAGNYRNDRSMTHCPAGHLLDLNNTHFEEDGARQCRACKNARYAAARKSAPANTVNTVADDVLDKARALLADPAHADLSLAAIAKRLGISPTTISVRLAAEVAARRSPRDVDPAAVAAARQMLADPSNTLTLAQIAASAGFGEKTMRRHLKTEIEARKARARKPVTAGVTR